MPPTDFFMMGDNRDNSTDSRVLSAVGYVPYENMTGRAQISFSPSPRANCLGDLALADADAGIRLFHRAMNDEHHLTCRPSTRRREP